MKAKTVKEVLVAARWIIENVGWCKGEFAKSGDKSVWVGAYTTLEDAAKEAEVSTVDAFCSLGAINAVDANHFLKEEAARIFHNSVGGSISYWNDNEKRTKSQVLKAFDRAIAGAE